MLIRQGEASWVVVFPLTVRMDTSLLALLTLSLTVSLSCQAEEVTKFQDCYSCLVFGPQDYIWCLEAPGTGSLAKGCISRSEPCEYPYTDKSEQTDSGDNPTASILPQKVTLKLRPNKEETVTFRAKKKENDIDMYFLLDLTSSMSKIKTKLGDITDDLMKVNKRFCHIITDMIASYFSLCRILGTKQVSVGLATDFSERNQKSP